MDNRHLNEDALIRISYGVAEPAERLHAAECATCGSAAAALELRRARATTGTVPDLFWERERREIIAAAYARQGAPRRVAVFAVAAIVVLALLLVPSAPIKTHQTAATAVDDDPLYELYVTLHRTEPRAIAPMRLLLAPEDRRRK